METENAIPQTAAPPPSLLTGWNFINAAYGPPWTQLFMCAISLTAAITMASLDRPNLAVGGIFLSALWADAIRQWEGI